MYKLHTTNWLEWEQLDTHLGSYKSGKQMDSSQRNTILLQILTLGGKPLYKISSPPKFSKLVSKSILFRPLATTVGLVII